MEKEEIKEDDIVLCKVKKIEKTTVFVDIEGNGQGSLVLSEIAAGRIRNLREYVAPNKKIVCKILKIIDKDHIELSLRRVTASEREEVLERDKKTETFSKIIERNVKNPEEVLRKIKEKYALYDAFEESREDPSILKNYVNKEEFENLSNILSEKKEKEKEVKEIIKINSDSPNGIKDIKNILKNDKINITYLGSSKFSLAAKAKDFKKANSEMEKALDEIKKKSKELNATMERK